MFHATLADIVNCEAAGLQMKPVDWISFGCFVILVSCQMGHGSVTDKGGLKKESQPRQAVFRHLLPLAGSEKNPSGSLATVPGQIQSPSSSPGLVSPAVEEDPSSSEQMLSPAPKPRLLALPREAFWHNEENESINPLYIPRERVFTFNPVSEPASRPDSPVEIQSTKPPLLRSSRPASVPKAPGPLLSRLPMQPLESPSLESSRSPSPSLLLAKKHDHSKAAPRNKRVLKVQPPEELSGDSGSLDLHLRSPREPLTLLRGIHRLNGEEHDSDALQLVRETSLSSAPEPRTGIERLEGFPQRSPLGTPFVSSSKSRAYRAPAEWQVDEDDEDVSVDGQEKQPSTNPGKINWKALFSRLGQIKSARSRSKEKQGEMKRTFSSNHIERERKQAHGSHSSESVTADDSGEQEAEEGSPRQKCKARMGHDASLTRDSYHSITASQSMSNLNGMLPRSGLLYIPPLDRQAAVKDLHSIETIPEGRRKWGLGKPLSRSATVDRMDDDSTSEDDEDENEDEGSRLQVIGGGVGVGGGGGGLEVGEAQEEQEGPPVPQARLQEGASSAPTLNPSVASSSPPSIFEPDEDEDLDESFVI